MDGVLTVDEVGVLTDELFAVDDKITGKAFVGNDDYLLDFAT